MNPARTRRQTPPRSPTPAPPMKITRPPRARPGHSLSPTVQRVPVLLSGQATPLTYSAHSSPARDISARSKSTVGKIQGVNIGTTASRKSAGRRAIRTTVNRQRQDKSVVVIGMFPIKFTRPAAATIRVGCASKSLLEVGGDGDLHGGILPHPFVRRIADPRYFGTQNENLVPGCRFSSNPPPVPHPQSLSQSPAPARCRGNRTHFGHSETRNRCGISSGGIPMPVSVTRIIHPSPLPSSTPSPICLGRELDRILQQIPHRRTQLHFVARDLS